MNIKWVGPVLDSSGYSKANRCYIEALLKKGVNIQLQTNYFNNEYNKKEEYNAFWYDDLINNEINYDKVVFNCIPNNLANLVEKDKFNISLSTWETDKLPESWTHILNTCTDGVIVPSYYNLETYRNSGVTKPIKVVPHCLDVDEYNNYPKIDFNLPEEIKNKFKFLSVFQWTERKNPIGLLKAYLTAFNEMEGVVLILKVHGSNHSVQEQERIKNEIKNCIYETNLKNPPSILFIGDQLSEDQMRALYHSCHCFVLASKSEGFGLPVLEAMACSKPIIVPNYGAVKELVDFGVNGFPVTTHITPVYGMSWINEYDSTQNWGEPDIIDLKKQMFKMYCRYDILADDFKEQSYKIAKERFDYDIIGTRLVNTLKGF